MAFLDKAGLEHLWAQIINQLNTKEDLDSKTTVISSSSTNAQYPGAKAVYDFVTANIPDTSTFATTTDLTNGTITVKNAINAEEAAHAAWANGTNNADYATAAGKAGKDGDGNVIKTTYATKVQLSDGSVTKIGNVLTIGGATYDGSAAVNAGRRSWYGVCPTTGNQPAKEVNEIPDFVLETGAKVSVRFTHENIASSPTLNVNSTGAKSIRNSRTEVGTLTYRWFAGQVVDFIYDGTYWLLQQPVVGTETYYGVSRVADLTLNNAPSSNPSFYAPTSYGTSNQIVIGAGASANPKWFTLPGKNGGTGSPLSTDLSASKTGYVVLPYNSTYDFVINYGITKSNTSLTFGYQFNSLLFALAGTDHTSDHLSQRSHITALSTTGITFGSNANVWIRYIVGGLRSHS